MLAGGYGALLNLLGLCLMAFDKRRARRGGNRIRERHKTKHCAFVVGIPAILAVQLLLVGWAAPQIANRL